MLTLYLGHSSSDSFILIEIFLIYVSCSFKIVKIMLLYISA